MHSRRTKPLSTLRRALFYRNWDGACTKTMEMLTGGAFLAGLALALGASDLEIGLIAAIPFLSKVMFMPAVWVIEQVRQRKMICVISSSLSRLLLVLIAVSPWLIGLKRALYALMGALALSSIFGTFAGLAWNSWMKDLLPEPIRGRIFSRRLWIMGLVGMAVSLAGALVVDLVSREGTTPLPALSGLYLTGAMVGLIGLFFLARIPEPPMPPIEPFSLRAVLALPFKDTGFRKLIGFTGSWAFAANLALPFITVYMLRTLGLPYSYVLGFAVASQLANLSFLNIWGRLADRHGNKAVLHLCAPVFSLSILLWTFTVGENHWVTLALIALIHIMNGLATAGIDVANDNILFQLSPKKLSTPYFSAAALVNSMAAGVAPLIGGLLGNLFAEQAVTVQLTWEHLGAPEAARVTVLELAHLDFVFLAAFLSGLFALQRLAQVKEREQEAPHAVVIKSVKEEIQSLSTIKGLRYLTQAASFFAGLLLESSVWMGKKKRDD